MPLKFKKVGNTELGQPFNMLCFNVYLLLKVESRTMGHRKCFIYSILEGDFVFLPWPEQEKYKYNLTGPILSRFLHFRTNLQKSPKP